MTVLELFAGAGGASLGLHAAGLACVCRADHDRDACATLRAAVTAGFLDDAPVLEGDIRAQDWTPYAGRVDLLWASPPCQAFSAAGKRLGARDARNGWPWTFDVVEAVRPTWVICENVDGMLHHRGAAHPKDRAWRPNREECAGCYFHGVVLPAFRARFAVVQWRVLNTYRLGVPQSRERLIIVAGPREIRWPEATHEHPELARQAPLPGVAGYEDWRTVRDALDLGWGSGPAPSIRAGDMYGGSGSRASWSAIGFPGRAPASCPIEREDPSRGWGSADPDAPSPSPRAGRPGGGLRVGYRRGRDGGARMETHDAGSPACALRGAPGGSSQPFILSTSVGKSAAHTPWYDGSDRPSRTTTAIPQRLATRGDAPQWHRPLAEDRPSDTIQGVGEGPRPPAIFVRTEMTGASAWPDTSPSVSGKGNGYLHDGDPGVREGGGSETVMRRLTVAECARLQSFPDGYPFQGTKTAAYAQVGNAVPPPLAEAIGRAIVTASPPRQGTPGAADDHRDSQPPKEPTC